MRMMHMLGKRTQKMKKRLSYDKRKKDIEDAKNLNDGCSWENPVSGMGIVGRDSKKQTRPVATSFIGEEEATAIYSSGIGCRIASTYAEYMTRSGVTIDGDTEGWVLDELDRLKYQSVFNDLVKWSKVYGGALVFIGANDVSTPDDLVLPLNPDKVTAIKYLRVFTRWDVAQIINGEDPESAYYNEPEKYYIIPSIGGTPFYAHASRVLSLIHI